MNPASVPPTAHSASPSIAPHRWGTPWVSWAAVVAGVVVALAVHICILELCVGVGLALYEPGPDSDGMAITAGTIIAILVAGLISIFLGGWVTGRMKRHGNRTEAAIHGGLVWGLASVLAMVLAAVTMGAVVTSAASVLGKSVSAVASGAGSAVKGIAGAAAPALGEIAEPTWDAVREQVEGAAERLETSEGGEGAGSGEEMRYADRSRLMQLLGRTFSLDEDAKPLTQAEETELRDLLAKQLGISPEAAQKTMDQWNRVWDEGVEQFEAVKQRALEAAEVAKDRTTQAAFIAFVVMLLSLVAAVAGAVVGCLCTWKCERESVAEHPNQSSTAMRSEPTA